MIVTTTATVQYACYLTDEEEEKVLEYAEAHPNMELTEVVDELWAAGEIDLYRESVETDFSTESIDSVDAG